MITYNENGLDFTDEEQGVWVTVPVQRIHPVDVRLDPVSALTIPMGTQDDFHPLRVIGNLKFTNPDNPEQLQFVFDPAVQMRVRYTCADLFRAMERGQPLALAYWNDQVKHWVRFAERPQAPDPDGYVYLTLQEFGDPAICWGT